MTPERKADLARSVHQRLLNRARAMGRPHQPFEKRLKASGHSSCRWSYPCPMGKLSMPNGPPAGRGGQRY
jgi:hypothetical protein